MTASIQGISLVWLAQRCSGVRDSARKPSPRELRALQKAASVGKTTIDAWKEVVRSLFQMMDLEAPEWQDKPTPESLPMVALFPGIGSRIVYGRAPEGHWLLEGPTGSERVFQLPNGGVYAAVACPAQSDEVPSARSLFKSTLLARRGIFVQAALASLVVNILALAASLYSMQVYDRVIPTRGISTLIVLTCGVLLVMFLELVVKMARSAILDSSIEGMDIELSHKIFRRLLGIRLDQLPASIGTLSAQLRSYETIRAFASTATLYLAVDAPFAILFFMFAWLIAGPYVAAVPVFFFIVALAIGMFSRKRVARLAATGTAASNRKLGLLVETVENAETAKATGSGWQMLARWNALNRESIKDDIKIRHFSESTTYIAAFTQQLSYVMLVGVGAWLASTTNSLTSGGIIACSILSGRMLAPVSMLPNLIVQWAHAKAALDNLEKVFLLECDNHGVIQPLSPEIMRGEYAVTGVRFSYPDCPDGIAIGELNIRAGEKVGILGSIGAGKSTLLKLLAGLYKQRSGRILLDGLDIHQISRDSLSQHLGYLPQDIRLFSGTLRDNLVTGLYGISEQEVLDACRATGLASLISRHPKGLHLKISEGGSGVSGGQKQLIALTRLILANPSVWLLDEPTAAMDQQTENRSLLALRQAIMPEETLILVTHKPVLLSLVERLIVLTPEGIAMDGPRDAVLNELRLGSQQRVNPVTSSGPVIAADASGSLNVVKKAVVA